MVFTATNVSVVSGTSPRIRLRPFKEKSETLMDQFGKGELVSSQYIDEFGTIYMYIILISFTWDPFLKYVTLARF